MAWATLNGAGVIEGRIELPRTGAWMADLAVDTADAIEGRVVLDLNGFQLNGTVRRGGAVSDTSIIRVVGGAGGLSRTLEPLAYQGVPLRVPLQDALAACGEAFEQGGDPELGATFLPFWIRARGRAGLLVSQLVRQLEDGAWRVLPSGAVWAGTERWPEAELAEGDYVLLREDPSNGREQLFADVPALLPGTAFRGRRVSVVEHSISEDQLRMVVWYE
jgi:hypothetical protein